jgi:hypothetical protein
MVSYLAIENGIGNAPKQQLRDWVLVLRQKQP